MTAFRPDRSVASVEANHLVLRQAQHVALPSAPTRVQLFLRIGRHHVSAHASIVATRDEDGYWHVDSVGSAHHLLVDTRTPMPHGRSKLDAETSLQIDRALANPCAFAEPTALIPYAAPPIDTTGWTLEIHSPAQTRIAAGFDRPPGGVTATLWDALTTSFYKSLE